MAALNFKELLASKQAAQQPAKEELPKAKFWLNLGYESPVAEEDGSKRFVSLPLGLPLDTQEPVKIAGKNKDWQAFQAARNGLLAQLMELAETLQPGEDAVFTMEVQLRRVSEGDVVVDEATNKYAAKLEFVGK